MGKGAKNTKIYFAAERGFLQERSSAVGEPVLVSQVG